MNRNQFDRDCATWSPDGRLFQVEYAIESLNNGTCTLGINGGKYAVLSALKR